MTNSITLDKGGANALTVDCTSVEEIGNKLLSLINIPTTFQEWESGPADVKIVDLLRFTRRINVDGWIQTADVTKFRNVMAAGGSFVMSWAGTDYIVNMEKYALTEVPVDGFGTAAAFGATATPDDLRVKFSVVEGVNL